MIRWCATVTYRSERGPVSVPFDLEEIAELHQLVEFGPHFDTVIAIEIRRVAPLQPALTVEEAERQ